MYEIYLFIELSMCTIRTCMKKCNGSVVIWWWWNIGFNENGVTSPVAIWLQQYWSLSARTCSLLFASFLSAAKMSVALKQWIIKQSRLMIKDDQWQQAVTAGCDSETWSLLIHSELSLHVFRVNVPRLQSIRAQKYCIRTDIFTYNSFPQLMVE